MDPVELPLLEQLNEEAEIVTPAELRGRVCRDKDDDVVLATALAYIVFFRIIATSGPANVLLVTMLIPVSAILMGHFVLGEELSVREIIGAMIICLALAVIDGRALSLLRRSLARGGSA